MDGNEEELKDKEKITEENTGDKGVDVTVQKDGNR